VPLVTRYPRGAPVRPSIVLTSRRVVHELRDAKGRLLAEVDDDTVTVLEGTRARQRFREIEVERHTGPTKLLQGVGKLLVSQGARAPQSFTAKHVRALGDLPPADFPVAAAVPERPDAGAAVVAALRADIGRVFDHDPLVRLRIPLPDGDSAVHQMRVGCRRLRSDLKTFRPVLDRRWADRLRADLAWLADALGAVRDAEVLRERLRHTAAVDPVAPLDADAVAHLDAVLARRYEDAMAELERQLTEPRYHALLEELVTAAQRPRLAGTVDLAALRRLAGKPWRQLADGTGGAPGAADLRPHAPDAQWHQVRIRAKRARYAVDAVALLAGGPARALAKAMGRVQNQLGEHQDAAVAAQTWLQIAAAEPADHALAVTAGRLAERERAAIRRVRAAFPARWADTCTPELTGWLG
jgi:CHAD domain-containing protein